MVWRPINTTGICQVYSEIESQCCKTSFGIRPARCRRVLSLEPEPNSTSKLFYDSYHIIHMCPTCIPMCIYPLNTDCYCPYTRAAREITPSWILCICFIRSSQPFFNLHNILTLSLPLQQVLKAAAMSVTHTQKLFFSSPVRSSTIVLNPTKSHVFSVSSFSRLWELPRMNKRYVGIRDVWTIW